MQVAGTLAKVSLKGGLAYVTGGASLALTTATGVASLAGDALDKVKKIDVDEVEFDKFIKEDSGHETRKGIREFRRDFEKLLKETGLETLVVVIDDLDRCNPATIIETLEAIKLFLFVPHTAFILGTDERLIKYAVRRRFPELLGERAEVGRDYLEKLIQHDMRIPPLGRAKVETYINLLFLQKSVGIDFKVFKAALSLVASPDAETLLSVRFNYGVAKSIPPEILPELDEDLSIAQPISPVLKVALLHEDGVARCNGISLKYHLPCCVRYMPKLFS